MVAYENPKTLRHMCNRLRKLGYVVSSTKWSSGQSAWEINLASGQTLYLHDAGKVTLGFFQRDRRLEALFNIPGPSDQVAYPLSSPAGVPGARRSHENNDCGPQLLPISVSFPRFVSAWPAMVMLVSAVAAVAAFLIMCGILSC